METKLSNITKQQHDTKLPVVGQSEQLVCPKCHSVCKPNENGNKWQKCHCCGNEWAN